MDVYQLRFQRVPGIVNLSGLPLKFIVFIGHIHPAKDKLFPLLHLPIMIFYHLGEEIMDVSTQRKGALCAVNEIGQASLAYHIFCIMKIRLIRQHASLIYQYPILHYLDG